MCLEDEVGGSRRIEYDKIPLSRRNLARVVRCAPEIFRINDVVEVLSIGRTQATSLLSRWTRQGWLRRVGPGAYAAAPIGLLDNELVLENPWLLVPALYSPAYVGGWSAAGHWGLTEQIFGTVVVMTLKAVRARQKVHHGTHFVLRRIQERRFFGLAPVWHGGTKILVSDIHRTVVDILDSPSVGGGIQHVSDCIENYLQCNCRNEELLLKYARQFGNGAVFKRLGFLAERLGGSCALVVACREAITAGNAKLDPVLECARLVSKWNLWIPARW